MTLPATRAGPYNASHKSQGNRMPDNGLATAAAADYLETRHHELRKTRMLMVDGNLTTNLRSTEGGVSARMHLGGYWGFAAMPGTGSPAQRVQVELGARSNALAMGGFGHRSALTLAGDRYVGTHMFTGRDALTPAQCNERLQAPEQHRNPSGAHIGLVPAQHIRHRAWPRTRRCAAQQFVQLLRRRM